MRRTCFKDPWFLIGKEALNLLQSFKEGGEEKLFETELFIGSVKAQSNRLKSLIDELEQDEGWKDNKGYYAKEVYEIEKHLRKIRKSDLEVRTDSRH